MQDIKEDEPTASARDHAAIVQLLNSEAWSRRLEEARLSRSKILAQKVRPSSTPVFRPAAAHRTSRQDLLPPLEPPASPGRSPAQSSAERGVVVQFQPPGAVFRPAAEIAEPIESDLPTPHLTSGRAAQIIAAFLCGLVLGAVLTALL